MPKTKQQSDAAEVAAEPMSKDDQADARALEREKDDGQTRMPAASAMSLATPGNSTKDRARGAHGLQRAVGNARAGEAMGGLAGKPKKPDKGEERRITTPLGEDVKIEKDGSAKLDVAGVPVRVLPDRQTKDKHLQDQAMTHLKLDWRTPVFEHEGGKISKVGPLPKPTARIWTEYGPGAAHDQPSAYGKGTTPADKTSGETTLGHHEGNHGRDYMKYIEEHPFPEFRGAAGMSVKDYRQAEAEYHQAMGQYEVDARAFSKARTDCVGDKGEGCA